jgi:hypothetical protein
MDQQKKYFENNHITKNNIQIKRNPDQNSYDILHRNRKKNPKIYTEIPNSQSNPEQKKKKKKKALMEAS